jgi:hypothetical protein
MKKSIIISIVILLLSTPIFANYSQGRITLADYYQIKTGMDLVDVSLIVGYPGKELSHSRIENESGATDYFIYQWTNDNDGSTLTVAFLNHGVVSKTQHGLK